MALLKPSRSAQYQLVAEFVFNFNDTAVDSVALTTKTFGSNFNDNIVLDCIPLPIGAVLIGGDLLIETAGVGPTAYTASLGVSGNASNLLAASSLLAAVDTRYPLVLAESSPLVAGEFVRLTIASTVANATAGKFHIRVMYTITGRGNEVVASL